MQETYIILGVILVGFTLIVLFINNKFSSLSNNKNDETLREWLKAMQASIDSSSTNMVRTLQENSKQLNQRLDKAAVAIGEMSELGKNMRELQEFLKSPKLRGNVGEEVLKDLIAQIFPKNSFHLQYQFKNGERVDAAIKTDGGILPIDSKFPMENFQKMSKTKEKSDMESFKKEFIRDVKRHIDAISKKYILPDEGTMDFALMYIPSEAVFYEVADTSELMDYARRQRVYMVSPTTLYAHLQMILLSFEGKKIETRSKEVFAMLRGLQTDYGKIYDALNTLGRHITNASSQYVNVTTSLDKMGKKLGGAKNLEEKVVEEIEEATTTLKN